jgi:hypothetical protein
MTARRNARQAAKADQADQAAEPAADQPKRPSSRAGRSAGNSGGRRGSNRGSGGNNNVGRGESAPRPTRRRTSLIAILLTAITVVFGVLTLIGLAPLPGVDDNTTRSLSQLSTILIQLVTVVGAFALILGVLNLLTVHLNKFSSSARGGLYSFVTLMTALLVVVIHLADRAGVLKALEPGRTPGDSPLVSLTLMDTLQVTLEAALAGLLAFFLVYAAYRLLRQRLTGWNVLFLVALIAVLIGYIPVANLDGLRIVRDWLLRVPVSAGTRGILIGVALGTIITGVRLLLGQDRSFRE